MYRLVDQVLADTSPLDTVTRLAALHQLDALANAESTSSNTAVLAEPLLRRALELLHPLLPQAEQRLLKKLSVAPFGIDAATPATSVPSAEATVRDLQCIHPLLPNWYVRLLYSCGRMQTYTGNRRAELSALLLRCKEVGTAVKRVVPSRELPMDVVLADRNALLYVESVTSTPGSKQWCEAVRAQVAQLRVLGAWKDDLFDITSSFPRGTRVGMANDKRHSNEVARQLMLHAVALSSYVEPQQRSELFNNCWSDLRDASPHFLETCVEQAQMNDLRDAVALADFLRCDPTARSQDGQLRRLADSWQAAEAFSGNISAARFIYQRAVQVGSASRAQGQSAQVQAMSNAVLGLALLAHDAGDDAEAARQLQGCAELQRHMAAAHPKVQQARELRRLLEQHCLPQQHNTTADLCTA